ncbi:hypothetical protein SUGI_0356370 [Cryptomeria japonica]|nr:hypothetical protein SUGI_0356370 [Cryptomeria japonica]
MIFLPSGEDRKKDLDRGPYFMKGQKIQVKEWTPNFDLWEVADQFKGARIYNLPVEYWDYDTLLEIGKNMGDLIKMEGIVSDDCNGQYAKMCFRVRTSLSFPQEIKIHTEWGVWKQRLEFEDRTEEIPYSSSAKNKGGHYKSKEAVMDITKGDGKGKNGGRDDQTPTGVSTD